MLPCTKATTTEHRCVTFELLLRYLSNNCQLGKKIQKACRALTSLHGQAYFAGGNLSAHARITLVQTFVVVACFELAQLQICLGGH